MKNDLYLLFLILFITSCGGGSSSSAPEAKKKDPERPRAELPLPKKQLTSYNLETIIQNFCPSTLGADQLQQFRQRYEFAINSYNRCKAALGVDLRDIDSCIRMGKDGIIRDLELFCDIHGNSYKIMNADIEEMK